MITNLIVNAGSEKTTYFILNIKIPLGCIFPKLNLKGYDLEKTAVVVCSCPIKYNN